MNLLGRRDEIFPRHSFIIKFKDEYSCNGEMEKYGLESNTSTKGNRNANNPRTFTHYVSKGLTEKLLQDLIESSDVLEDYTRHLLDRDIHFNKLDLTRNQLQFEVIFKDKEDYEETVKTCTTPFNSQFWRPKNATKSKFPGFQSVPTLHDMSEDTNQGSSSQEIMPFGSGRGPDRLKESVSRGIEKLSNAENVVLDGMKECDTLSLDDLVIQGLLNEDKSPDEISALTEKSRGTDKSSDNEKSKSTKKSRGTEKSNDKFDADHFSKERFVISCEGKSPTQEYVPCDGDLGKDLETALKQSSPAKSKRSSRPQRRTTDTHISKSTEDIEGKVPISKSVRLAEESLEKRNLRNVETSRFMKREDYPILGSEQELECCACGLDEPDVTARSRKYLELLMEAVISGQSKALLGLKEVYVSLQSDMSIYFFNKYHYYDVQTDSKQLILLLAVAGLNDGKGVNLLDFSQVENTQVNHSKTSRPLPYDKPYRNDRSKKWGGNSIKALDKSGRVSPEGGNDEDNSGPPKSANGNLGQSAWEVKEMIMDKRLSSGLPSGFFDERVDTDVGDLEQDNANPSDLQQNGIPTGHTPREEVQQNSRTPESDTEVIIEANSFSDEENNENEDESDESDEDLDFNSNLPGVRTVPEGASDSGGAMGGYTGEQAFSERHRPFVQSWNVNLGDNGQKCLYAALKGLDGVQHSDPSTMFLLDLSKSMQQPGKIDEMKSKVKSILEVAGSKHFGCQMSETFGIAVFGHTSKVLLYPSRDLGAVQETLDSPNFPVAAGRSPLALGLLLCTCVWFTEKGTGGTVWLHGRKIRPRIIVISDLEFNETATGGEADDTDALAFTNDVLNQLITIALKLKALGIPVYVMSVGNGPQLNDLRTRLGPPIRMTGGKIMEKSEELLGRQAWQQILSCNILDMLDNVWGPMTPEEKLEIIKSFAGEDPEDRESIRKMMAERKEKERNEEEICSLLRHTGEPGEQLWREFPLGDRVQDIQHVNTAGTIVGHLPNRRVLIQWDSGNNGEFASLEMSRLVIGTARDCREYEGETHRVGSRVRRVIPGSVPHETRLDDTDVGTVVTLSALQPNVVYVAWDRCGIRRHSCFDICRFIEKDDMYDYDFFWLFRDSGQWQPFPVTNSKNIEEKYGKCRTMNLTLGEKGYRLMFKDMKMRLTSNQIPGAFNPVFRQAVLPT